MKKMAIVALGFSSLCEPLISLTPDNLFSCSPCPFPLEGRMEEVNVLIDICIQELWTKERPHIKPDELRGGLHRGGLTNSRDRK